VKKSVGQVKYFFTIYSNPYLYSIVWHVMNQGQINIQVISSQIESCNSRLTNKHIVVMIVFRGVFFT